MTYDEMFKAMLASKQDSQQGFNRLLEIHLKWKRLAAEVR